MNDHFWPILIVAIYFAIVAYILVMICTSGIYRWWLNRYERQIARKRRKLRRTKAS